MLVYDKAYMELKSQYLIPISLYSVPYTHLRNTNIKRVILTKSTSVDMPRDNEFIFHFEESDLFKALLGDIELFYIRQVIQKNDAKLCGNKEFSANWNIVTNYYSAFFVASLMLRLCHRGNVFLDNDLKREIEKLISSVTGNVIKLDANQFYEIFEKDGEYVLKLSPMSDGTHELVWRKMDGLIDEMRLLTRKKSDEELVLSSIKEINNKLANTYPSRLRNRVNYQPLYGLQYIDKKLFSINENISWIDQLIHFSSTDNDNQIACYMYAYTKYMEHFCMNFMAEYYDIRGCENGILHRINENRDEKIGVLDLQFTF